MKEPQSVPMAPMLSRRAVMAGMGILTFAPPLAHSVPAFSPLQHVCALRITGGPLQGAFTVAPLGVVNWYFGNIGLLPFVARLRHEVRGWLDLQLGRYDLSRGTIADVEPDYSANPASPSIKALIPPDSDDAYAATLLELAARYDSVWTATAWWAANVSTLRRIADGAIRALQKPSGLTRTFRNRARPGADISYLMDNCEVHSGLTAFAARLRAHGDRSAAVYDRAAKAVALGIARLFDREAGAFRASDADVAPGNRFYPDATAQVFPELHGVSAPGLGQQEWDAGWAALGRIAPLWPKLAYDPYPWLLLGTVAAGRSAEDKLNARHQLASARALYASEPSRLTISELAQYQWAAMALR